MTGWEGSRCPAREGSVSDGGGQHMLSSPDQPLFRNLSRTHPVGWAGLPLYSFSRHWSPYRARQMMQALPFGC